MENSKRAKLLYTTRGTIKNVSVGLGVHLKLMNHLLLPFLLRLVPTRMSLLEDLVYLLTCEAAGLRNFVQHDEEAFAQNIHRIYHGGNADLVDNRQIAVPAVHVAGHVRVVS